MKIQKSQPIDLTGYINHIGPLVHRDNFPHNREWTEPPEGPRMDLDGGEMPKHEWELEPLLAYEQPSRKEIAWVTAIACVLALVCVLAFALSQ